MYNKQQILHNYALLMSKKSMKVVHYSIMGKDACVALSGFQSNNRHRQSGEPHFESLLVFSHCGLYAIFSPLSNHCLTKLLMHSTRLQTDRVIWLRITFMYGKS